MRRTNLLIAAGLAVFVVGLPLGILLLLVPSEQNCGTSSPASPSAPPPGTQTAGQVVRYLESQRFSPFGAAGIVGNLQQESGLNPTEAGGGLAQWNPSWYARMSAWATGHGLSPTSMAGQLEVSGLRPALKLPAAGLRAQLGDLPRVPTSSERL
jgi:hypothetical protein